MRASQLMASVVWGKEIAEVYDATYAAANAAVLGPILRRLRFCTSGSPTTQSTRTRRRVQTTLPYTPGVLCCLIARTFDPV